MTAFLQKGLKKVEEKKENEEEKVEKVEEEAAVEEMPVVPVRYEAVLPVLDALAARLGVSAGDGAALLTALDRRPNIEQMQQGAGAIYDSWMEQAEKLKEIYPGFELEQELKDERFLKLLGSQVDMQTAYEVVHNREIIPAAMQYAARAIEQKLARSLRSSAERPVENGIRGGGAVMMGSNVSRMSKKDYAAVCRMVERGERVSFG